MTTPIEVTVYAEVDDPFFADLEVAIQATVEGSQVSFEHDDDPARLLPICTDPWKGHRVAAFRITTPRDDLETMALEAAGDVEIAERERWKDSCDELRLDQMKEEGF